MDNSLIIPLPRVP